ncbi:MAG: carbon storage regulator CsrA [Thermodesulfobacteriota bacterium]
MLVLTRKIGETIRIGENVTVRVLALRGGQVSLGFTAPSEVRIFREEVLQAEGEEPASAAEEKRPGVAPPRNGTRRHG